MMHILYKFKLLILFLIISKIGIAQVIPNNNFYLQNPFTINPAAAGINGNIEGYLNYRDQWSGIKGAPETLSFDLHGLITSAMGLGLNIKNNKSGVFKQFSIDLNYSYRVNIQEDHSVAFGLMFGVFQNDINYGEVIIANESDPALHSSNAIDETIIKTGFGIHYNWHDLNVHLSTPMLYNTHEKTFVETAFGHASYNVRLADDTWQIQPSVLYRYSANSNYQMDFNLKAEWDEKVWGLAGYRTNKNILAGFGISLKNIGIGYIYEINRSELSVVSPGSHEIMLCIEIPNPNSKKKPFYKNTRPKNGWD